MINIVAVDDNKFQLDLLKNILLVDENIQIHTIDQSELAFNLICSIMPDIIILDIVMPKPDGIELRNILLSDARTKNIPVIFLSASEEDKKRGLEAGCYDYILKPFSSEKLLNSIKSCRILQILSEVKLDIQKLKAR